MQANGAISSNNLSLYTGSRVLSQGVAIIWLVDKRLPTYHICQQNWHDLLGTSQDDRQESISHVRGPSTLISLPSLTLRFQQSDKAQGRDSQLQHTTYHIHLYLRQPTPLSFLLLFRSPRPTRLRFCWGTRRLYQDDFKPPPQPLPTTRSERCRIAFGLPD